MNSAWLSCMGVQIVHCTKVTHLKGYQSLCGYTLISMRAHRLIHRLWSLGAGEGREYPPT